MRLLLLGVLMVLTGCASTEAIHKNYNQMVNTADGVSAHEAKLIAQHKIIAVDEKRNYRITAPDVKADAEALKYPDYWFVVFGHNWFSPVSMDPAAKTYTELRETQYLVVINKSTGDVKFFGEWYPKREKTFFWVFDQEGYMKEKPALSLPPGIQSKERN